LLCPLFKRWFIDADWSITITMAVGDARLISAR